MHVNIQLGKEHGMKYNVPKKAFIKVFIGKLWLFFHETVTPTLIHRETKKVLKGNVT